MSWMSALRHSERVEKIKDAALEAAVKSEGIHDWVAVAAGLCLAEGRPAHPFGPSRTPGTARVAWWNAAGLPERRHRSSGGAWSAAAWDAGLHFLRQMQASDDLHTTDRQAEDAWRAAYDAAMTPYGEENDPATGQEIAAAAADWYYGSLTERLRHPYTRIYTFADAGERRQRLEAWEQRVIRALLAEAVGESAQALQRLSEVAENAHRHHAPEGAKPTDQYCRELMEELKLFPERRRTFDADDGEEDLSLGDAKRLVLHSRSVVREAAALRAAIDRASESEVSPAAA